ncbi:hypothetical protein [Clostridium magnum]|uniref:Uncharacterized protein n=1 Tax=Clostridium magnum DSM 2767 TaxID=1121326 RepID=A0A161WJW2_9CLOT|nr:hypothetical protein [Clostridium magnum]KZL92045.1 hypothetical protein CLMAG_18510 [Clostridium magnum DSM 2767]SHH24692.1 peptide/nickel transport system substrate-binding protein [Clostridium magnum DSM 2767]
MNKKKITSVILSFLLVISAVFTGCGSKSEATATKQASSNGKILVYGAEFEYEKISLYINCSKNR